MLRISVGEQGQPPLPAVDLDEPRVVIGSGAAARIRIPAAVAREAHVEVTPEGWRALAEVVVDGERKAAGERGPIAGGGRGGVVLELGGYLVQVEPSPAGAVASTPRRTESLARELVRSLLGAGAAPALEIERGPGSGASRALAPPESAIVIGRGDEAAWVILDEDLSRAHVEVRRGWDGVQLRDLGSKNGTRVDGAPVGAAGIELRDGARIELGNVVLRFRDPAERHLRGEAATEAVGGARPPAAGRGEAVAVSGARSAAARRGAAVGVPRRWVVALALAIAVAAFAGLIWVLAG
ncbi:MAG TPA: FHA domain-containing protein [Kofleriaceae bacterium]|nr:FHA domain-containing protein [Kofleriaceae bacterium]